MAITRPLSQTFLQISFEPSLRLITEVAPALEKDWEGGGFKLRVTPPNLEMPFVWGEELEGVPARHVSLSINTATYGEMGIVYEGFKDFYPRAEEHLRLVLEKAFGNRIPWKTMAVGYVDLFVREILEHLTPNFAGIDFDATLGEPLFFQGVFPQGDARILIEIVKPPDIQESAYMAKWFYESGVASWEELKEKAFTGHEALRQIFLKNISQEMKEELYGQDR
jgi:hypothetical protein